MIYFLNVQFVHVYLRMLDFKGYLSCYKSEEVTLLLKPRIFAYLYRIVKQIYTDGNSVVIVRTDSNLCPVKNLELYMVWGNI